MIPLEPLIAGALIVTVLAGLGVFPARKYFQITEARSEMREGSTSKLRAVRGWSMIAVWAVLTMFAGSFVGDWAKSGDFDGAAGRALDRAEFVLQIVAMIMESDQ